MTIQHSIKFGENKSPDIFSDIAKEAAVEIKSNNNVNKTTQLRKFYDELAMWNERVQLEQENKSAKFKELEPFIKMLKAKVAYAKGRKHIDENFMNIFNKAIDEIKCPKTLKDAKLFIEAVMGYCKLYEAK
ncbi:type III-A CRISPR-associated protein Csm2 [Ursidibacter sp. B-7004-1]